MWNVHCKFFGAILAPKMGPNFWPWDGPLLRGHFTPYGGAILAPYGGAILAPKTGPNFWPWDGPFWGAILAPYGGAILAPVNGAKF